MVHGGAGQLICRASLPGSSGDCPKTIVRSSLFSNPTMARWFTYGHACLASHLFGCLFLPSLASPAEFGDVELSVYALGSWPRDHDIFNQGTTAWGSIERGGAAGLKVGLFPNAMGRMAGLEIDSYGHGGGISFPNTAMACKTAPADRTSSSSVRCLALCCGIQVRRSARISAPGADGLMRRS